jgi:hypothetical protein
VECIVMTIVLFYEMMITSSIYGTP